MDRRADDAPVAPWQSTQLIASAAGIVASLLGVLASFGVLRFTKPELHEIKDAAQSVVTFCALVYVGWKRLSEPHSRPIRGAKKMVKRLTQDVRIG